MNRLRIDFLFFPLNFHFSFWNKENEIEYFDRIYTIFKYKNKKLLKQKIIKHFLREQIKNEF